MSVEEKNIFTLIIQFSLDVGYLLCIHNICKYVCIFGDAVFNTFFIGHYTYCKNINFIYVNKITSNITNKKTIYCYFGTKVKNV